LLHTGISECLNRTNKLLYFNTTDDKFATLFYGILNIKNHKLHYSNAGHNYPMLFNSDNEPQLLKTGGTILGWTEEFPYREESVQIEPGDLLLVYSDGITEAMNRKNKEFGESRLISVVTEAQNKTAQEISNKIITSVRKFMGTSPQTDDMTLVIIRRNR